MIISIIVLIAGFLTGSKLYRGRDTDPLKISLFANKFYFDEIYAVIVKFAQDRLAWIVNALEKIFVDTTTTGLPAGLAGLFGRVFRRVQNGSLQSYAWVFGAGVIIAIYVAVFVAKN